MEKMLPCPLCGRACLNEIATGHFEILRLVSGQLSININTVLWYYRPPCSPVRCHMMKGNVQCILEQSLVT